MKFISCVLASCLMLPASSTASAAQESIMLESIKQEFLSYANEACIKDGKFVCGENFKKRKTEYRSKFELTASCEDYFDAIHYAFDDPKFKDVNIKVIIGTDSCRNKYRYIYSTVMPIKIDLQVEIL